MLAQPVLVACLVAASGAYQVPAAVMYGIMQVEGGRAGQAVGPNFDGSYDLGTMQVNSLWVGKLAQIWHVDRATARQWLRDNACENIYVATWIFKQKVAETGTLYGGIAHYHSATQGIGYTYADKVVATMSRNGLIQYEPTILAEK